MKIKVLKAFNGDCILINFIDDKGCQRNILIDGGISETYLKDKNEKGKKEYGDLKNTIDSIRESGHEIDLLILTHIDDDHIAGILKWFKEDDEAYKLISEVWFNSGRIISKWLNQVENEDLEPVLEIGSGNKTSPAQGIKFVDYIFDKKIWFDEIIIQGQVYERFGLTFKILSPDKSRLDKLLLTWKKKDPNLKTAGKLDDYNISLKDHIKNDVYLEDKSISNGSSIAFIVSFGNQNFLFLGDAHPKTTTEGLEHFGYTIENPLKCELVKLSHHGSQGNTSKELLEHINSDNYIVSTNGMDHAHPHKQMLARLINTKPGCNIYFNYKERMNKIFNEHNKGGLIFNVFEITGEFNFL